MRCLLSLVAAALLCAAPAAAQPARLKVVASFSILADLVKQVGGEHVELRALVGPGGDMHVYQPTPSDARAFAGASLVVVNGLGFEGWIERLARSSGYQGRTVVATEGVRALEMDDEDQHGQARSRPAARPRRVADPHAWHSVENVRRYVTNITRALAEADPPHAQDYRLQAERYQAELAALERELRAELDAVPADKRKVITSHDAFQYLAQSYGIEFIAAQGATTDREASASAIARLIRQIRRERVKAVFIENITNPRLIEQLAKEAGVTVAGELYSDALSPPGGPAASYVELMRHNVRSLKRAMLKN